MNLLQTQRTLPSEKSVEELIRIETVKADECSVSLQFWSEDLIPDEVTYLLGINPTRSSKKGDVVRSPTCEQIRKFGLWLYSVNKFPVGSLEAQINILFDKLTANIDVWRELSTRFEADLLFGLNLEQSSSVLNFSQQTLQRIRERSLSISLDLYFDNHEQEENL